MADTKFTEQHLSSTSVCPICLACYSLILRKPGDVCGDCSRDQERDCVGRVILLRDFERAEWTWTERPKHDPIPDRP
jgi:hypothetical protein